MITDGGENCHAQKQRTWEFPGNVLIGIVSVFFQICQVVAGII